MSITRISIISILYRYIVNAALILLLLRNEALSLLGNSLKVYICKTARERSVCLVEHQCSYKNDNNAYRVVSKSHIFNANFAIVLIQKKKVFKVFRKYHIFRINLV